MAVRPSTDHVTLRATGLAASLRLDEATLGHSGLGLEFEREGLPPSPLPTGRPRAASTPRRSGRDNGAPGPRPGYRAVYNVAYALDPDGSNVEAVRHTRSPFVENRVRP